MPLAFGLVTHGRQARIVISRLGNILINRAILLNLYVKTGL